MSSGARSGQRDFSAEQFGPGENEEASQRVGPFADLPRLLRELGTDPTEVMAGFDTDVLGSPENRGPFVAMGRLLHQCAVKTGCQHFGLLSSAEELKAFIEANRSKLKTKG